MIDYKIIKIGGSLVSPRGVEINRGVIASYIKIIREVYTKPGSDNLRLILVIGGGSTSRTYRDAALKLGEDSDTDQHRIGITVTWLNSELVRALIDDLSYRRVLGVGVYAENRKEGEDRIANEFQEWLSGDIPILVSGGFVSGASTDFNAILLAHKIGVSSIYKLTNIDYVYTSDPKKDKKAKPIKDQSWRDYLDAFAKDGIKHAPSAHIPIDLPGAKLARDTKVSCQFADGEDIANFRKILLGKEIEGTFLHP
jgi:uridylate kinase